MRKSKKIAIAVSLVCIVLGLGISTAVCACIDLDFSRLNTARFETNTYEVTESFSGISINTAESDIRFAPSQDGVCRVVCAEADKVFHTVSVDNSTLTITRTDQRNSFLHFGIHWGETSITVYLPEREYEELKLVTLSGDISVPGGFTFIDADIRTTSGEIDYSAPTEHWLFAETTSGDLRIQDQVSNILQASTTSGELKISRVETDTLQAASVSGDIQIASSHVADDMSVESVSGEIDVEQLKAFSLTAGSSSGDIELSHVTAADSMDLKTISGEIELERCDAQTLRLKSTSGNVSGTLLSDKFFSTHTTSGTVRIPDTIAPPDTGKCEITTTSGNISIKLLS